MNLIWIQLFFNNFDREIQNTNFWNTLHWLLYTVSCRQIRQRPIYHTKGFIFVQIHFLAAVKNCPSFSNWAASIWRCSSSMIFMKSCCLFCPSSNAFIWTFCKSSNRSCNDVFSLFVDFEGFFSQVLEFTFLNLAQWV